MQICVLVTEDIYVSDARSTGMLVETERDLGRPPAKEGVVDEMTQMERYKSTFWA